MNKTLTLLLISLGLTAIFVSPPPLLFLFFLHYSSPPPSLFTPSPFVGPSRS